MTASPEHDKKCFSRFWGYVTGGDIAGRQEFSLTYQPLNLPAIMQMILPIINACVFILISMLHVYWALGGEWGYITTIPTDSNGRRLLRPGPLGTFAVAAGLLFFAVVNLGYSQIMPQLLPHPRYLMMAIAAIFLLRAIGEFRYIGFTKKYRTSAFAKMDSRYFSPLCLALALSHLLAVALPAGHIQY
ncbi:DUF3995 domain-containing protein [Pedobacter panaciterrae]|uniref:DUF3995 domain-containing protein n=1 Tax=Pedobacter panaciterrae TaxID=363849 RepID=UPI00259286D0|nr:DUF3995 domain-containing protein [uncultured Pedobacter sp.]